MARKSTRKPLELFILRNKRTKEPVISCGELHTFELKGDAKAARDDYEDMTGEQFIVSPGPQHKNWRG